MIEMYEAMHGCITIHLLGGRYDALKATSYCPTNVFAGDGKHEMKP